MIEYYSLKSNHDDLSISVMSVIPACPARAILIVVHGLLGSKERFIPFMESMSSKGILCIAHDHRGHGESIKSEKDRGYMYKGGSKAMVNDLKLTVEDAVSRYGRLPVFILGHSMGSMAVRSLIKQNDRYFKGVILCGSPAYTPLSQAGRILTGLATFIGLGRIRPKMIQNMTSDMYNKRFKAEGPQAWTCSDPSVRHAFANDPRYNFRLTINGAHALTSLIHMAYIEKNAVPVTENLPIIMLQGGDDPCAGDAGSVGKSADALRICGYENVCTRTYPHMRHEILNETGKENVWNDILSFITSSQNQD